MKWILVPFAFLGLSYGLMAQTPKTEGPFIRVDKLNILYSILKNPISINQSFDSLKLDDGEVLVEGEHIYLIPFKAGRKTLYMYRDSMVYDYPFIIKEHPNKPFVVIPRKKHSLRGPIQEKQLIFVEWDVDYRVRLKIQSFRLRRTRPYRQTKELFNESGEFNQAVLECFKGLQPLDQVEIYDVKCQTEEGRIVFAENFVFTVN